MSNMNTVSNTQHNIKHRDKPNDKIYTPRALVKLHLEELKFHIKVYGQKLDGWKGLLDPCAGEGAYYNMFSTYFPEKYIYSYCEIEEGGDFFKALNVTPDGVECADSVKDGIIVGNLPFSLIDAFLEKSVSLEPEYISYLMPMYAITPARQEMMEQNGYSLIGLKHFKWFVCMGMCCFATWRKMKKVFKIYKGKQRRVVSPGSTSVTYDRTVWYPIEEWEAKKKKKRLKIINQAAAIGKKKHKAKWWCNTMQNMCALETWCFIEIHKSYAKERHYFKWRYSRGSHKLGGFKKWAGWRAWEGFNNPYEYNFKEHYEKLIKDNEN